MNQKQAQYIIRQRMENARKAERVAVGRMCKCGVCICCAEFKASRKSK